MSDPEEREPGQGPKELPQHEKVEAAPPQQGQSAEPSEAKPSVGEPAQKPTAPSLTERDLSRMNRRELLKLTPLVLLGAFAVPKFQDKLLEKGVALSDWASGI